MAASAGARRSTCCTAPRGPSCWPRASACPARRPRRPGELVVVSWPRSGDREKAHERNPELAAVRHVLIVDENLEQERLPHDIKDVEQPRGITHVKPGPVSHGPAASGFTEIGRPARQIEGSGKLRVVERGKHEGDRKHLRHGANSIAELQHGRFSGSRKTTRVAGRFRRNGRY